MPDVAVRTRLIINADDFGMSPAVNTGILEAHFAGTVTSTSMMVGCPGWEDAAARISSARLLGVGLHFNLLVGAPLTRASSLTDHRSGRFLPLSVLVGRTLLGRVAPSEVEAECEAQLAALECAGVAVTHIDSHRHTHALPAIRRAVARVALRRGLPLRRPVEPQIGVPGDIGSRFHRALIAGSWRTGSFVAPRTRAPDHFCGVSMQGSTAFEARLIGVLARLPVGSVEIMVHPGYTDAALATVDGYTWQRERELAVLLLPAVRDQLAAADVTLIHFGQL